MIVNDWMALSVVCCACSYVIDCVSNQPICCVVRVEDDSSVVATTVIYFGGKPTDASSWQS